MNPWDIAKQIAGADGFTVAIVCVLCFLYVLNKKWIRLGREFDAKEAECEFWKERCLRATDRAEALNQTAQRALSGAVKTPALAKGATKQ
jgi:hypothetical protein